MLKFVIKLLFSFNIKIIYGGKMKIIFANRQDCLINRGGDTVQMLKTKEYLEKKYNLDIVLCLNPDEIFKYSSDYLVHIFNLQTVDETMEYIENAQKNGNKILLSTIYWDLSYSITELRVFKITRFIKLFGKFKNISKILGKTQKKNWIKQKQILEKVDFLLPNSEEELEILIKQFRLNEEKIKNKTLVIPNAIENKEKSNNEEKLKIDLPPKFILQVGRIELVKNQYSVVKALEENPEIPIVFIGRVAQTEENLKYYEKLLEISNRRGNVFFISEINHDELQYYYRKAELHILPSLRESPGLVTLEALYHGSKIVVADKRFCPVTYYEFDKIGSVINPYDIKNIKEGVLKEYNKRNLKFNKEEYFEKFSYANVAKKTKEAYEIIGGKK